VAREEEMFSRFPTRWFATSLTENTSITPLYSQFQFDSQVACYRTWHPVYTLQTDVSTWVVDVWKASNGHIFEMSAVVHTPAIVGTIVKLCLSACTLYVIEPYRTTAASISVTERPAAASIACKYMNNILMQATATHTT